MPPPSVRTRSVTSVALPTHGDVGGCRRVPLSPFDAYWVALPPVRRVFLFPSPPPPPRPLPAVHGQAPFGDVVRALRDSLEAVLPAFYPFAGALVYSPEERTVSIVVGPSGGGVAFVEAETDLDIGRLLDEGEEHDEDALRKLVPDIRRDELPAPVMAAQVTEFVGGGSGGGGVAVGVAVHHAAADGRGLWRFLEMWSAAAAAAAAGVREVLPSAPPLHDRTLVQFDGDGDGELVRLFLRQIAPDLPKIVHAPLRQGRLSRRTFTFAAPAVKLLKQRTTADAAKSGDGGGKAPSTFVAMAAHGWVAIARASGLTDDGGGSPVFAVFLADVRTLMSPPAPGAYAGNCVALCVASLNGAELAGPDARTRAAAAVMEAIDAVRRDPLGDRARWHDKFARVPPGRAVIMAGSPWFPAYAVQFGLGRPAARAELASMNHDGEVVLVAGREAGSVQASVAIAADKMAAFREMFVWLDEDGVSLT
uniref:Transferase family protein n=1 Tax=Oryza punctata TaxID=4537 RepID=A0A0E0M7G8_ORYPU